MHAKVTPVRLLILAFGVLSLAQFAVTTALAIYGFTAAGALGAGLAGARVLPSVVAGVVGGRLAARVRPGIVLLAGSAGEILALGAMGVALFAGAPFAFVLALSMVDAVVMMAYRPAQARLLPALVRTPSELTAAAAGLTNAKGISQIPGFLAGGLLMATVGAATTFLISAVVIAVASAVVIPVVKRARAVDEESRGKGSPDHRLPRLDAGVVRVMVVSGMRTFVRGLWLPLTTIVALDMMGLGDSAVGIMMAAAGLGTLVAVPASRLLVGRRSLLGPLAVALLLCGVPLLLIAAVPVPVVALGLLVIWGVGTAFADCTVNSLLFRLVAGRQIAQVVGSLESLRIALGGLGALAAPVLVGLFGLRGAIICAGAVPLAMLAVEWHGLRRVDGVAGRRVERIERLGRVPLFNSLRVDALEQAAASLVAVQTPAGAEVIHQDDADARRWFLIEDGIADVLVGGWHVGTLGPGSSFGEKALLRSVPRAATVRARTPLRLQALDRAAFLAAATGDPSSATSVAEGDAYELPREPAELLQIVPLLTGIEQGRLEELAALGRHHTVRAGDEVVREGEAGDSLYVLLEGQAAVYSGERQIRTLAPSDHFGEIALLHRVPCTATVRSLTDVRLFSIDREALLSAHPDCLAPAHLT